MAAILNQGLTALRDATKVKVTHVGVATDASVFAAAQTVLDPAGGGAANRLIKAKAQADVDFQTADFTMTIDGTTEMTNKTIFTIGVLQGAATADAMTRSVRTQGIGVQAGDAFTLGVRMKSEDNTP